MSVSEDQTLKLWDTQSGHCLRTLDGYSNWVLAIAFSADGQRLASGSEDQCVRVWDVETGDCLRILQGHTHLISSVPLQSWMNLNRSEGRYWLCDGEWK
jgi:WD40 repeat protein